MAKHLKTTQYTEEQETRFRGLLSNCKHEITQKEDENEPKVTDFPADLHSLMINNPYTFKTKLKSGDRSKRLIEFAKFCYGKYKVPRFLDKAWYMPRNAYKHNTRNNHYYDYNPRGYRFGRVTDEPLLNEQYDYKSWWICLATGGSLYKEYCKDIFTKKELNTFINCSFDLPLDKAIIYAVAIGYGATPSNAIRLAHTRLHERKITAVKDNYTRDIIQYFAKNETESVEQTNDLIDYLIHARQEDGTFTPIGRKMSLAALTKRMKDWHYDLRRRQIMGNHQWEGHPLDNFTYIEHEGNKNKQVIWKIRQILNSKDLSDEGTAMHHCVASYVNRCKSGYDSIWSMTSQKDEYSTPKRRLTIELLNNGAIAQARGFANRMPTQEERDVLTRWCRAENLINNRYY